MKEDERKSRCQNSASLCSFPCRRVRAYSHKLAWPRIADGKRQWKEEQRRSKKKRECASEAHRRWEKVYVRRYRLGM